MQRDQWALLAAPFPPEALTWGVAELAADNRALLEPRWSAAALRQRFDEILGVAGWSYQLIPASGRALICNLTISGVSRAAVAEVRLVPAAGEEEQRVTAGSVTDLADLALARAAAQFGVAPKLEADPEEYWVDFDPESGEALFLPVATLVAKPDGGALTDADPEGPAVASAEGKATAREGAVAEGAVTEGQAVIQRLIDRLNAEGLGKEAAKLVVEYHGYGRTPQEARELYGRLRALLVEQGAAP